MIDVLPPLRPQESSGLPPCRRDVERGARRSPAVGKHGWMAFDLNDYIAVHLRYELKYLLVDATTWSAVRREEDRGPHAPHLVVMAMESAFVHTRVLYEFLTHDEGWSKKTPHERKQSDLWDEFKTPMHTKVLHPCANRPYVPTNTSADDLKDKVVDLALDVLRLWDEVAGDTAMVHVHDDMTEARRFAVEDALHSARWFGVAPSFL